MHRIKYIFIGIILISFLPQCKKYTISSPPGYAIGVITFYGPATIFPHVTSAEIKYSFFVNGKEYLNEYYNRKGGKEWKIPRHGNYNAGDQYMVQYNVSDPAGSGVDSRMLFDYPVADSSAYKQYVIDFKTNPPK
jgi:predicted glycosyl hydrolase (DUF1957 family)